MRVVCDVEANALNNPTKIWVIVCKDIDTGALGIFRNVTESKEEQERFIKYASNITHWVGHNFLEYDYPVLNRLLGLTVSNISGCVTDTLIISRLVDYSREGGHSIEQYGIEFGLEKIKFNDWTKWSQEMEDYCVRDVELCHHIYFKYLRIIDSPAWRPAIECEHRFQLIVNDLHNNGFAFNRKAAGSLLARVAAELEELDVGILKAFPPREVLIREFTPKLTKFGTISRTSVPRSLHPDIHKYNADQTYRHTKLEPFNPSSHKQLIEVLTEAGWTPENKTQTHVDTERELNRLRYSRTEGKLLDIATLSGKLEKLKKSGWKIDEVNLGTLPDTAPAPARLLAKRIMLESRRRTLTEWLSLVDADNRIRGKFIGLGAWTGRMAHQKPNTANIPREFKEDGTPKLLGREMRELWVAPKNRLLVGVDAEGIQLRIFAHYIDDPEFTRALVEGRKDDKTDPHSLNQRILGGVCKTRQAAKRFVYALLLGGGLSKLAFILGCSQPEAKEALTRLLERYAGFAQIRKEKIPQDAARGWFQGLDNRRVPLPGTTKRDREHLAMSGYLQNGEAVVIKRAAILIDDALHAEKELEQWMFVNIVHDEYVMEVRNEVYKAEKIKKICNEAIETVGKDLNLKCPLSGTGDIGLTWAEIH